ncbi:hypothetical protein C8Q76DRAFT_798462 [Earliella scabrosa]|nr:hypothetical protein C8Q76DRAFT_798462 [Earliella scabrosa]
MPGHPGVPRVETVDERPTVLTGCGHVLCYGCFKKLTESAQPFCPFRCDTTRMLRQDDGRILEFSYKEGHLEADKAAAIAKKKAEISRASTRLYKRRRQMRNDTCTLTALICNQRNIIAKRVQSITRDAVKAEELREKIYKKQEALRAARSSSSITVDAETNEDNEGPKPRASRISRMSPRRKPLLGSPQHRREAGEASEGGYSSDGAGDSVPGGVEHDDEDSWTCTII